MGEYSRPKIQGTLAMTKLKNELVKLDPNLKIELKNIRINGQLQGCSGFVTSPASGRIAYISTESSHGSPIGRSLYRTAESTRDYRGGSNQFATNDELSQSVVDLLKR